MHKKELSSPKPHYLKSILKKKRIAQWKIAYQLKYSEKSVWAWLNNVLEMPKHIEAEIRNLIGI